MDGGNTGQVGNKHHPGGRCQAEHQPEHVKLRLSEHLTPGAFFLRRFFFVLCRNSKAERFLAGIVNEAGQSEAVNNDPDAEDYKTLV